MTDLRRVVIPKSYHTTAFFGAQSVPVTLLDEGACAGMQDDWDRLNVAEQKAMCRTECPVRDECLAHARANREWGVWGGVEFPESRTRDREVAA